MMVQQLTIKYDGVARTGEGQKVESSATDNPQYLTDLSEHTNTSVSRPLTPYIPQSIWTQV